MGYLRIAVYEESGMGDLGQDKAIDWFAEMHTGSRIDFSIRGNSITLYNKAGEEIFVEGYKTDDIFDLIGPKTPFTYKANMSKWDIKDNSYIEAHTKYFESLVITDRDLFNIYVRDEKCRSGKDNTWYVGDIKIESSDDPYILYSILLEISAIDPDPDNLSQNDDNLKIKRKLEDELVSMYRKLDDDISIPMNSDALTRKTVVGKMIFSLKGICSFKTTDSLSILKQKIFEEKYYALKSGEANLRIFHPRQISPNEYPHEVIYRFPRELTWSDIIAAMGIFTVDKDDKIRTISICPENIEKTVRYMIAADTDFNNHIVKAAKAFIQDENSVFSYVCTQLREMVISHELGHMVFRSIKKDLSTSQNESLANWFSCLLADDLKRAMIAALTGHQSDEYKDYINIPEKYMLTAKKYKIYCDTVNELLRTW